MTKGCPFKKDSFFERVYRKTGFLEKFLHKKCRILLSVEKKTATLHPVLRQYRRAGEE